jgi:L-alanine-DL-glutamate epimerase-like enolase superfamily enzyme
MKITAVEVIPLRIPNQDASIADGIQDDVVVRVHTDEGLTGLGEADSSPLVVKAVIEAWSSWPFSRGLREILIGRDPFEVERLWEEMRVATIWMGRAGVAMHAISAVDMALWDIIGKATGRSLQSLLGGAFRDRIRVYASTLFTEDPGEMSAVGQKYAAQGFTAVKFGWGPMGRSLDGDVRLVETARRAIGDEADLLIDAGCVFQAREAIQRARAFEPYRPFWFEEALQGDDLEGFRRLSRAARIRIASGEQLATVPAFEALITQGGVDVIQPDVARAGGITESRRIAQMAARHHRLCVFHAWKSGILLAATLRLAATLPVIPLVEYTVSESPLRRELVRSDVRLAEDGQALIPDTPGLGIELNEEVARKYRVDL